ncbi:MAG: FtsX-like permease family protein [Spirochaetota bacterium]
MGILLSMAYRNLFRNKRRSLLAASSVMFSITLIVFMQGFYGGFMDSIIRNATRQESGHIKITTKEYSENERFLPVNKLVDDPGRIAAAVAADRSLSRDIALVTERIRFGVLLNNRDRSVPGLCIAGDITNETKMLMLNKAITAGRYLSAERDVIVGEALARSLGISVGSNLVLMTEGSDGSLRVRRFSIVGLFKTGAVGLDKMLFQVSINDARKLLRAGKRTQEIIIMLNDYRNSAAVGARLEKKLKDDTLAVLPWQTKSEIGRLAQFMTATYNIMYFVIALLGAFIITNVIMMVVLERKREIGIMKAMGFSRAEILGLFLSEGVLLGAAGSIAGSALGLLITGLLMIKGVDLGSASSALGNFPLDTVIFPTVSLFSVLTACVLGAVTAAIVSFLPASRAASMAPIDAIKSV